MAKPWIYQLCFAACLLASPALLADDKTGAAPPAGETADRLIKLERMVADLQTEMKLLLELKRLPDRLDQMDRSLSESLARVQEELKALRVPQRIAKDVPDATLSGNAQLQLVNTWDSPVLVVIDGTDYLLQPNKTKTITRRPGRFNYEVRRVDGSLIQAPKTSDLRSGDTPHMIEVFSR
jgi:hypothetical protein